MKTRAIHIEHHAVIAAHDAVFLNGTVLERCAAMHAMRVQHTNPSAAITECHEFFVEYFQVTRSIGQFDRHADGMPKRAHVLAHRRAGTGLGQLRIVARHLARVVPAEGNQLLDGGRGAATALLPFQLV